MKIEQFALWRAERDKPTPPEDRLARPIDPKVMGGYWRIERAKTRHDTPVMIWTKDGDEHTVYQRATKRCLINGDWEVVDGSADQYLIDSVREFCNKDWFKCVAVTKADWASAIETGRWPDGKPSRQMSTEEKLGIDTGAGDNAAPVEEVLEDQIAVLAEKLSKAAEPATQAEADALTGDLDRMRALLKKAGAVREEEFRPHKAAADAVSEKWATIMKPGQDAGTSAEAKRKAYLRKEQARLDAEAAAERKRIADEAAAARKAAEDAAAAGAEPPPVPPEPAPVVEAKRATAGTSFGRQSGLKKTQVGKIVNLAQLVNALLFDDTKEKDADAMAYFQARADKAAKGGFPLPGTVIEEAYR